MSTSQHTFMHPARLARMAPSHSPSAPVKREPDPTDQDAELEVEAQRQQELHFCDQARYTEAADKATVDGIFYQEFFHRRLGIPDTPFDTDAQGRRLYHACDPALYYRAIDEASFEGAISTGFFNNIVAHITYRIVSSNCVVCLPQNAKPAQVPGPLRQATHATHGQASSPSRCDRKLSTQAPSPAPGRPSQLTQSQDDQDNHECPQSPVVLSIEPRGNTQNLTRSPDAQANYNHAPLSLRQSTEPREMYSRAGSFRVCTPQPPQPSEYTQHSRPARPSRPRRGSHTPRLPQISPSDALQPGRALSDLAPRAQQKLSPGNGPCLDPALAGPSRSHFTQRNQPRSEDAQDGSRAPQHPGIGASFGSDSGSEPLGLEVIPAARPARLGGSSNQDVHSPYSRRSRSPDVAMSLALTDRNGYRSRSPLDYGDAETPASNSCRGREHHHLPEVNDHEASGAAPPMHDHVGLSNSELQKTKNQHIVCVQCWIKDLSCDHSWPCHSCVSKGKVCAYVLYPLYDCSLNTKCPAYHVFPGLAREPDEKVGSSMHLVALLNLKCEFIRSYDLRQIRELHDDTKSAQHIYLMLQKEIDGIVQQKKGFGDSAARKLLRDSEKVPDIDGPSLSFKACMIAKLVQQKK